jgi:hypothetical protein
MQLFRDLPSQLPDDMAIIAFGMRAPDTPFVPDEYKHTYGYFIQLETVGPTPSSPPPPRSCGSTRLRSSWWSRCATSTSSR